MNQALRSEGSNKDNVEDGFISFHFGRSRNTDRPFIELNYFLVMLIKTKSCLLLEDDPEDQEFFMDALSSVSDTAGCYAVANGEEALLALLEENFSPDYIFTDLNMPRMDGFEFMRIIQRIEKLRTIPIIVYSSDFSDIQLERVKALGASAFYSKTRLSALPEILKRYFGDHANHVTVM